LTVLSSAAGGILGCAVAAYLYFTFEINSIDSHKSINPNMFFSIYTAVILLLFLSVLFLSKSQEPEIIRSDLN
jgi:uncharacterized membrane protein YeaQ/YmgE (transglycosylase-associated protein family)